jgi:ADP-heptose:LPS heptosyltransferase
MDAVVAVDSGPLHLAQAMQIPVLGFLSGGDSARWFAKPNPQHRIASSRATQSFSILFQLRWALKRWVSPLPHRS